MKTLTLLITITAVVFTPLTASYADDALSQAAVRQFQNSAARFGADVEADKIPSIPSRYKFTYDIKKTDSLIQPAIGLLELNNKGSLLRDAYVVELSFDNGYWKITKFTYLIGESGGQISPDNVKWTTIQSYFVSH